MKIIQHVGHFFGLRVYHRVKIKKNIKLQNYNIFFFNFIWSFLKHNEYYRINLKN